MVDVTDSMFILCLVVDEETDLGLSFLGSWDEKPLLDLMATFPPSRLEPDILRDIPIIDEAALPLGDRSLVPPVKSRRLCTKLVPSLGLFPPTTTLETALSFSFGRIGISTRICSERLSSVLFEVMVLK